jgi:two-component system response regulator HydG
MSDAQVLQADDFFFSVVPSPQAPAVPEAASLEQMEKVQIARVLKKYGGNVSRAARELRISRAALYRRMEKHGL